jgi:O-antigen ligase
MTASALFACVDFYFQFPAPAGFGEQYVWLASGVYRRAQGVFYEASTLGNVCASFLVLTAVCLARRTESPIPKALLLAGGGAFFTAMMLSFSRASLVNLAVALPVLLWMERGRIAWARAAVALSVAAGVGLAALWRLAPQTIEYYFSRLLWSASAAMEGSGRVLSGRAESWAFLADFLAQNPWQALLGVGYKTLAYSDVAGKPVVADNAYLSALVETGLLGLAALLAMSLSFLRLAWRASQAGSAAARIFGTWMLCFWCGQMAQMLSGDLLTYWRVLLVYFWALGMAVRYTTRAHEE